MSDFFQVSCPHCNGAIIIYRNEINCQIFRHGAYITSMQQIPPHAPKAECDMLVSQGLVVGCAKPFRVEYRTDASGNQMLIAVECDYI